MDRRSRPHFLLQYECVSRFTERRRDGENERVQSRVAAHYEVEVDDDRDTVDHDEGHESEEGCD